MMNETNELQNRLQENTAHFKEKIVAAGFEIRPTQSAIVAIMLFDAKLSQEFASALLDEEVYVTGFYYPVVPQQQARIRVQLSAAHTREQLDTAIEAFLKIGRKLKVIL
jgi:glycine C-acetyltransferase